MLGKISIIAGIERTVSRCAMGSKKVCSPLVEGKLPITIIEGVYNLKKYVRCGVLKGIGLHHSLLTAIDETQQDEN